MEGLCYYEIACSNGDKNTKVIPQMPAPDSTTWGRMLDETNSFLIQFQALLTCHKCPQMMGHMSSGYKHRRKSLETQFKSTQNTCVRGILSLSLENLVLRSKIQNNSSTIAHHLQEAKKQASLLLVRLSVIHCPHRFSTLYLLKSLDWTI